MKTSQLTPSRLAVAQAVLLGAINHEALANPAFAHFANYRAEYVSADWNAISEYRNELSAYRIAGPARRNRFSVDRSGVSVCRQFAPALDRNNVAAKQPS